MSASVRATKSWTILRSSSLEVLHEIVFGVLAELLGYRKAADELRVVELGGQFAPPPRSRARRGRTRRALGEGEYRIYRGALALLVDRR